LSQDPVDPERVDIRAIPGEVNAASAVRRVRVQTMLGESALTAEQHSHQRVCR